eukprot:3730717-Ditylum_brightwellii.AAC.1
MPKNYNEKPIYIKVVVGHQSWKITIQVSDTYNGEDETIEVNKLDNISKNVIISTLQEMEKQLGNQK